MKEATVFLTDHLLLCCHVDPPRGILCHWVEDGGVEVKLTEGNLPSFLCTLIDFRMFHRGPKHPHSNAMLNL